jgi:predicted ArsR family transcriptional regulator
VSGKTLDTRLEQLTQLREADGYMSTWETDAEGTFILREANCPIIHVATSCDSACSCDMVILENLLDAEVIRTNHLAKGDGACVYEVRPKSQLNS